MANGRAVAKITKVDHDESGPYIEYMLAYDASFKLDQQRVNIILTDSVANMNNDVQKDAMDKINAPVPDGMGPGTIANKDRIVLWGGRVS